MNNNTAVPFGRPMYVMLKPVGASCNLGCDYCYYLDKGSGAVMDDSLLEEFTRQYIEVQTTPEVLLPGMAANRCLNRLVFIGGHWNYNENTPAVVK